MFKAAAIKGCVLLLTAFVVAELLTPVYGNVPTGEQKLQRLRKKNHLKHVQLQTENGNKVESQSAGQFHPGEPSPAYVKCKSLLEGVSGDSGMVDQTKFLQFRKVLTGGKVNENSFDEVDDTFAAIFYQAACAQDRQCDGGQGFIQVDNTLQSFELVSRFCDRIMERVTTTTGLTFGYSIRFDTDTVSKVSTTRHVF